VGILETEKEECHPPLLCVESSQLPVEGILIARAPSRVRSSAPEPSRTQAQPSCSQRELTRNSAYVMIANFSSETLTLSKSTVLGVAEGVSVSLVDCINTDADQPTKPQRRKESRPCMRNCCEIN
jgi:hypothetical protein